MMLFRLSPGPRRSMEIDSILFRALGGKTFEVSILWGKSWRENSQFTSSSLLEPSAGNHVMWKLMAESFFFFSHLILASAVLRQLSPRKSWRSCVGVKSGESEVGRESKAPHEESKLSYGEASFSSAPKGHKFPPRSWFHCDTLLC